MYILDIVKKDENNIRIHSSILIRMGYWIVSALYWQHIKSVSYYNINMHVHWRGKQMNVIILTIHHILKNYIMAGIYLGVELVIDTCHL